MESQNIKKWKLFFFKYLKIKQKNLFLHQNKSEMSSQIFQTNAAPFGYIRPVTETVMVDDSQQHLNVAIPQAINYPSLTVLSPPIQPQSTAPPLPIQSVPNTVQYRVMSPWRLLRPSNKVHPSANDERDITNNVSVNVNHQNERNRRIIIWAAVLVLILLVFLTTVISTIVTITRNLKEGISQNIVNETLVYTIQEVVECSNVNCGCIFQPCMNGGKCSSVGYNSFACSCHSVYSGTNCQICNIYIYIYFFFI